MLYISRRAHLGRPQHVCKGPEAAARPALMRRETSMNLPENSTSAVQQEILDALPVLVFLERAGQIVYANIEARRLLGMTSHAWMQRPVEDVLWGLFPGTADPQTSLSGGSQGSPFHATLAGKGGHLVTVEGTYSMVNAELREAIIIGQAGGRD